MRDAVVNNMRRNKLGTACREYHREERGVDRRGGVGTVRTTAGARSAFAPEEQSPGCGESRGRCTVRTRVLRSSPWIYHAYPGAWHPHACTMNRGRGVTGESDGPAAAHGRAASSRKSGRSLLCCIDLPPEGRRTGRYTTPVEATGAIERNERGIVVNVVVGCTDGYGGTGDRGLHRRETAGRSSSQAPGAEGITPAGVVL